MNDEVIAEKVKQLEADIKEIKDDIKDMPDKIAEKIDKSVDMKIELALATMEKIYGQVYCVAYCDTRRRCRTCY